MFDLRILKFLDEGVMRDVMMGRRGVRWLGIGWFCEGGIVEL